MNAQRRLDLIVADDHELRRMRDRYVILRRLAHEEGSDMLMVERWQNFIDDIDVELSFRSDDDSRVVPL